jgi:hypothetical protein
MCEMNIGRITRLIDDTVSRESQSHVIASVQSSNMIQTAAYQDKWF